MSHKGLHFVAGFVATTVMGFRAMFYYGFNGVVFEEYASKAVALTFILGVGKEVYDAISNKFLSGSHTVEAKDAWYTIIGSMPYFLIALGV